MSFVSSIRLCEFHYRTTTLLLRLQYFDITYISSMTAIKLWATERTILAFAYFSIYTIDAFIWMGMWSSISVKFFHTHTHIHKRKKRYTWNITFATFQYCFPMESFHSVLKRFYVTFIVLIYFCQLSSMLLFKRNFSLQFLFISSAFVR